MLGILPEIDVAMVEDVSSNIDVVEALGRENHADVISSIEEGDHLGIEVHIGDLISCKKLARMQNNQPGNHCLYHLCSTDPPRTPDRCLVLMNYKEAISWQACQLGAVTPVA